jgi:hypothetical protein
MTILLPVAPVGALICTKAPKWAQGAPVYSGVSFCRAVDRAGAGEPLLVKADSIDTCQWAPATLGLRPAESKFEEALTPGLPSGIAAIYLARLDQFPAEQTPDVVIVRAPAGELSHLAEIAGWGMAAWDYADDDRLARSALKQVRSGRSTWRTRMLKPVNQALSGLEKAPGFKQATIVAFKSRKVSAAFEAFISRTLASMSVCRNSLVIPHLSGRFNISYLCSGGVTWGQNFPYHLTSGWPWRIWERLEREVSWQPLEK